MSEKEKNPHDACGGCLTVENFKVGACILYYYGSSIALILYNKWLFKVHGFEYPLIVTAFHFSLCFLFATSWVWWAKSGNMCSVGSSKVVKRTVVIGVMTGMDVSLTNLSYLMVSIPFMEMVRFSPIFMNRVKCVKCAFEIDPLWIPKLWHKTSFKEFVGVKGPTTAQCSLPHSPAQFST